MRAATMLDVSIGVAFLDQAVAGAKAYKQSEGFRKLMRNYVKPLLLHRFPIAILSCLSFDDLSIRHRVSIDYSDAFLVAIPIQAKLRKSPVIARWLAT